MLTPGSLTWRFCFYINLPIGAFTLLVIYFFLHLPPAQPQARPAPPLTLLAKAKRLDPLGLLFFVPSMVCLILALEWGGTKHAWPSAEIIGLLVTFSITFVAFLVVEYKFPDMAMAPPRVVLNRSVGSSLFFTFMSSGGMMCAVYYLAIWFQAAQGQSAMQAGIRSIPMVVSLVLFGIVAAIVVQKMGYYVPALLVAPILAATGSGMLSTLDPSSSSAEWIGYQVLYGMGIGAGAQSANLAAQTVLPREDVPLGTAMSFFVQQLGGAMFVPVGQNLFSTQLIKELSGVGGLDTHVILNTGATDLKKVVPASELGAVMDAYSYACTRVFVLGAALSACMIIGALGVEWRSIKKEQAQTPEKTGDDTEKV
jgi:MFS family permease